MIIALLVIPNESLLHLIELCHDCKSWLTNFICSSVSYTNPFQQYLACKHLINGSCVELGQSEAERNGSEKLKM